MVRLRDHFAIRRSQRGGYATFRAPSDLERGARAVQSSQSLSRIFDAVTLGHGEFRVNARPIVRNREFECVTVAARGDDQAARVRASRNAVTNRVLH